MYLLSAIIISLKAVSRFISFGIVASLLALISKLTKLDKVNKALGNEVNALKLKLSSFI